jgi:hypothetical protein
MSMITAWKYVALIFIKRPVVPLIQMLTIKKKSWKIFTPPIQEM